MKAEILFSLGTWRQVADMARETIGKEAGSKEPSDSWKKRMLLCEHSPIRLMQLTIKFTDMPYWVSVHLVRHHIGIEHFVKTQRSDRTGIYRGNLPQDAWVAHTMVCSLQALINVSRKRLCMQASKETRAAWIAAVEAIREHAPIIASVLVPDCVYRGHCYEFSPCGFAKSELFSKQLAKYREI